MAMYVELNIMGRDSEPEFVLVATGGTILASETLMYSYCIINHILSRFLCRYGDNIAL